MKHKLISTDEYYLLVDEEAEIKEGDYCSAAQKIIAHLPKGNAPKLEDVDLLPKLLSDKEDIEQLFTKENLYEFGWMVLRELVTVNQKSKYKQAIEEYGGIVEFYKSQNHYNVELSAKQSEKMYNEEDKWKLTAKLYELAEGKIGVVDVLEWLDNNRSLSTTTPIDFIVEMIDNGYEVDMEGRGGMELGETCWMLKLEPKVINGVLQGKWIYK
jgi:hypothetical protein